MASVLHGDFETRSTIDLKTQGAELYARHPSTDILCFGFKFDDEPTELIKKSEPLPQRVFSHIQSGGLFVAHNAPFELAIWNHTCAKKYGWPILKPIQTHCTMAMAYAMALPGSLEKASAAMGIDQQKDMAGNRIMLQLSQPREVTPWGEEIWWDEVQFAEKYSRLYEYCKQDINVEAELYKRLMKLSASERRIWLLDQEINQRGIQIDISAAKKAMALVEFEQDRLNKEMNRLTGGEVKTCTANLSLASWIREQGVPTEGVAKDDVNKLLSQEIPAKVRMALRLRQEAAKSSTAKLKAMLVRADENGRIRGIFQYHGAGTGRWAGRGIQPQNFPRPSIEQEEIEQVFNILEGVG